MPDDKKGFAVLLLRLFQSFSLDVVGGSLAMGVFATKVLGITANGWWWLVLALSVWAVYTGDHLLDGYQQKQWATMFRHRIHYRFRYFLIVLLILAAFTSVALVALFMERRILTGGIFLGLGVLIYLGLNYLGRKSGFYFHKEFFISLFYVSGIWLAPVIWYNKPLPGQVVAGMVVLFLLGWAEGLMMAYFEQRFDEDDHAQSFSTFYGLSATRKLAGLLMILAMLLSLALILSADSLNKAFYLLFVLSVLLFLLPAFPAFFKKNGYYRILGEFSFWIPFALLF